MVQDPPQSESIKERNLKEKKPRQRKTLKSFDPWKILGEEKANITWKQLLESSPLVCAAVKEGIAEAKRGPTTQILNVIPQKKERSTTLCYAFGHIGKLAFEIIVDTGAGPSLISQEALNRLGWNIEGPTETTLVIADGSESIPLGVMYDVPITFGDVTVTINMQVTNSTSYEIIISTNWLEKAKAIINMSSNRMQITNKGVTADISLNIRTGARPRTVNEFNPNTGISNQEGTYQTNHQVDNRRSVNTVTSQKIIAN
jgi:hypothetical protein